MYTTHWRSFQYSYIRVRDLSECEKAADLRMEKIAVGVWRAEITHPLPYYIPINTRFEGDLLNYIDSGNSIRQLNKIYIPVAAISVYQTLLWTDFWLEWRTAGEFSGRRCSWEIMRALAECQFCSCKWHVVSHLPSSSRRICIHQKQIHGLICTYKILYCFDGN